MDFIKSQTQSEYSNEIMEQVEQNIPVTKAEGKAKEQRKIPASRNRAATRTFSNVPLKWS